MKLNYISKIFSIAVLGLSLYGCSQEKRDVQNSQYEQQIRKEDERTELIVPKFNLEDEIMKLEELER
jgi:hypothetical protein